MNSETKTIGVFAVMADFKSYEIDHWLQTTSRALLVVCKEGESGQPFYILNTAKSLIAKHSF